MTVCDSEFDARAGIPEEIEHKKYATERDLFIDLKKFGLDDLHILLNQDGLAIWREMPYNPHVVVVREITFRFNRWKNGRSLECDKGVNVYVNDSFNTPKNMRRCPHFAIFGPDRLNGHSIRTVNGDEMNPHVIIQFSWTNSLANEKCAVNDIMHFAGVGEYVDCGRPIVAYLIKARRRGSSPDAPVYGFDVFKVEQDQSTPEEPTMRYRWGIGGQEDTVIRISLDSMGLVDDGGEPFTFDMRDICEALDGLNQITFVPALENEM